MRMLRVVGQMSAGMHARPRHEILIEFDNGWECRRSFEQGTDAAAMEDVLKDLAAMVREGIIQEQVLAGKHVECRCLEFQEARKGSSVRRSYEGYFFIPGVGRIKRCPWCGTEL